MWLHMYVRVCACVCVLCMHVRVFLIIQKKHMLSEVELTLTMWMHGQVGTAYEGHAQQLHHRRRAQPHKLWS